MLRRREMVAAIGTSIGVGYITRPITQLGAVLTPQNPISIEAFGANLQSASADHTQALQSAIASRKPVILPALPEGQHYRLTRPLDDQGGAQIYGAPGVVIEVAFAETFLTLSGSGSIWSGLRFAPVQDKHAYGIVIAAGARGNTLRALAIAGGNSGLRIEGADNNLDGLDFAEMVGTSIRLEGTGSTGNRLSNVRIRNGALAGILHENGAHHNLVERARKWVERSHLSSRLLKERATDTGHLGGDICAYAASAHHNVARNIACADARDGCFTISGNDNKLIGGEFVNGLASGCAVSGSRNSIANVTVRNCKTGFRLIPQAGGLAKDNVFTDCVALRSAEYGFRADGNAYREWQAGLTRDPPTHFCYYGLAVFRTPHATRTFGDRAPVHHCGRESDGISDWTFVTSDTSMIDSDRNTMTRCRAEGSGGADWLVRGKGALRLYDCDGAPVRNGFFRAKA